MRPIEFRGKRIDNGEWVKGWFIKSENGEFSKILVSRKLNDSFMEYGYHDIDPSTVGQFTGLQDKNGFDIFEGDRWKLSEENSGVIRFDRGSFMVDCFYSLREFAEYIEITGTIHDAPRENKRAKRRRKLGYDEPSMDERTDNINNAVEALGDTPSEKGE